MEALEDILQQLEKDIESRFMQLMDEMKADFAKHSKTIEETKAQLQSTFEQLEKSPHNAANYKRTSYTLDQQVNQLSRRFRPRMLHVLDELSPKYKTIEKPLLELHNFRRDSTKSIEEHLWLLKARNKTQIIPQGINLFELEFVPQLNKLCHHPQFGRFRYTLLLAVQVALYFLSSTD